MSRPKILIHMDSNERGSQRVVDLVRVVGSNPDFDLAGFAELPVDMRLSINECPDGLQCVDEDCIRENHDGRCNWWPTVNVELKEIPDFWASKGSGHLGSQLIEMVAQGQPAFVAVFGCLSEALAGVPKVKSSGNPSGMRKAQVRSQCDIQADISTARAFCADAAAVGVPVHFLSSNHVQSFSWVLSYAKHILTGANMASWLPRMPVEPRGYAVLCAIQGIGDVAARGLLEAYGGVGQIANEAKLNPEGLARCQIGGKALGKAKAQKLVEVFG